MNNKLSTIKFNKAIFSDFDGTLSNITISPGKASINPLSKISLAKLKNEYIIGIISGRPVKNISNLIGIECIYYVGNHGAEILFDGNLFVYLKAVKAAPLIKTIADDLRKRLKPPFELDFKKYSASIHYRKQPNPIFARKTIMKLLSKYDTNGILEFNDGRMVVEIRVRGINKATALSRIIKEEQINDFIYLGDDSTDIDVFNLEKPGHFNIAVKNPEADSKVFDQADLILNDTDEVAGMLGILSGQDLSKIA